MTTSKSKLLILGSGGFIGSNLIRYILKSSKDFIINSVDIIKYPHSINTIYSNRNHKFNIADASNKHIMEALFQIEGPDIVIDCTSNSIFDKINITNNIINLCNKYNSKYVYISDNKVNTVSSNEIEYQVPNSFLTASLNYIEDMIIFESCNYLIARLPEVYGPRQSYGLVPNAIKAIQSNSKFKIEKSSQSLNDWTHVQDACDALLNIISEKKEIYNIESRYILSYGEVYQQICNHYKSGYDLLVCGDEYKSVVGSSKLLNRGWTPEWKFTEGLSSTIDWYNNNKWFLESLNFEEKCQ